MLSTPAVPTETLPTELDLQEALDQEPLPPALDQKCMSTERLDAMFKKTDAKDRKTGGELFRAALERLSFRSSKRRKGRSKYEVKVEDKADSVSVSEAENTARDNIPPKAENTSEVENTLVAEESTAAVESVVYKPPLPPGRRRLPASATWEQSRPLAQLDSALRQFRSATAESRENLNLSRPDISAIQAEVAKSHPGTKQIFKNMCLIFFNILLGIRVKIVSIFPRSECRLTPHFPSTHSR